MIKFYTSHSYVKSYCSDTNYVLLWNWCFVLSILTNFLQFNAKFGWTKRSCISSIFELSIIISSEICAHKLTFFQKKSNHHFLHLYKYLFLYTFPSQILHQSNHILLWYGLDPPDFPKICGSCNAIFHDLNFK